MSLDKLLQTNIDHTYIFICTNSNSLIFTLVVVMYNSINSIININNIVSNDESGALRMNMDFEIIESKCISKS